MNFNQKSKILIVGLGLIGGSYAHGLSQQGYEVGGITKEQGDIDFAIKKGYIKHGRSFIDRNYIAEFDIIILALYPHILLDWLEENQKYIKKGAIITDVTGVKVSIVYKIQDILREDLEYIGAHPMAGREVSGIEYATKDIFKNANYIVTPTERNSVNAIEICKKIGEILEFKRISILSPEAHDEMIAFLSQLTHCIAISLMLSNDSKDLFSYTGNSFRDLTRIARLNDEMWSELFLDNKDELVRQIDIFINKISDLKKTIVAEDRVAMRKMMKLSTERRKYLDENYK